MVKNAQSPLAYEQFMAVAWTLTFGGIALTFGRYMIRLRTKASLKWDDFTHGFALLNLIIFISMYSVLFPLTEKLYLYSLQAGPKPTVGELKQFYHLLVPAEIFFWIVLYQVKLTFMLLYQQIFAVKQNFMFWWWLVLAYQIIAFLAAMMTVFWSCGDPLHLYDLKHCLSEDAANDTDRFAPTNVGLNVAGDLMIMALPLYQLKQLQMHRSHKWALAVLFLLGFVIIAFDITRISVGIGGGNSSLAALWDVVEPAVAVIVSTLPTYRAFFVPSKPLSSRRYGRSYRNDYHGSDREKLSGDAHGSGHGSGSGRKGMGSGAGGVYDSAAHGGDDEMANLRGPFDIPKAIYSSRSTTSPAESSTTPPMMYHMMSDGRLQTQPASTVQQTEVWRSGRSR